MLKRLNLGLAMAALPLAVALPASAIEVEATVGIGVLQPSLEILGTGEPVPYDAVLLSIESPYLFVSTSLDGPGRAKRSTSAVGTITNTLDEALLGLGVLDFGFGLRAEFDDEDQRAEAEFGGGARFGNDDAGSFVASLSLSPSCSDFPCSEENDDSSAAYGTFTIGANETMPIYADVYLNAVAVAPIPLPAAAFPMALALGGLAWAGWRRPRR